MSKTAVINIRTKPQVKNQAQKLAEKLGLNLSTVINAYLKQFIRTKSVSFDLESKPSKYLLESLEQSKKDIKSGYVSPVFSDPDNALKWLKKPDAKYANEL